MNLTEIAESQTEHCRNAYAKILDAERLVIKALLENSETEDFNEIYLRKLHESLYKFNELKNLLK